MTEHYRIAGIGIQITGEKLPARESMQPFACKPMKLPDVKILFSSRAAEIIPQFDYNYRGTCWGKINDNMYCLAFFCDYNTTIAATAVVTDWREIEIYVYPITTADSCFMRPLMEALFYSICPIHNGIVLHSAAIEFNGGAIVFSAPSGTGKSTQADLWVEHYNASYINADRPMLRVVDGEVMVCGTAWSGSDEVYENVCVLMSALVFIEQHTENEIRRLTPAEAIKYMLPRCFLPYHNKTMMALAMDTVAAIIKRADCWHLKCLPDVGAVELVRGVL